MLPLSRQFLGTLTNALWPFQGLLGCPGGGEGPHSTQPSEVGLHTAERGWVTHSRVRWGGGGAHLEYHALIVLDQVEGKGIRVHECVAAVAEHIHSLVQELRLQGHVTDM